MLTEPGIAQTINEANAVASLARLRLPQSQFSDRLAQVAQGAVDGSDFAAEQSRGAASLPGMALLEAVDHAGQGAVVLSGIFPVARAVVEGIDIENAKGERPGEELGAHALRELVLEHEEVDAQAAELAGGRQLRRAREGMVGVTPLIQPASDGPGVPGVAETLDAGGVAIAVRVHLKLLGKKGNLDSLL